MPSKIQLDENLWFLFICLQKSDYKNIDFNAVGDATNLKAPAARMRYTRLRRQIENGTLIGTHGTPFQRSADKTLESSSKRKRSLQDKDDEEALAGSANEKIKLENKYASDEYETDTSYETDSGDDIPLAKRKAQRKNRADNLPRNLLSNTAKPMLGLVQGRAQPPIAKRNSQSPQVIESQHRLSDDQMVLVVGGPGEAETSTGTSHDQYRSVDGLSDEGHDGLDSMAALEV